ncbi:hypothetical protein Pla175_41450 [Pirellulimonas nuda]|uniref:PhnB-like domain-containing protein n=1 Tax=Pirellulimonas nuda TaxID=2528009 RepID=A0A518DGX8_9BACT|nr:VOC family protein [Pirellulimonas nuda]QDU90734.1 hypothetical protein Pla175_41450 [Pirellulimonas nuda]
MIVQPYLFFEGCCEEAIEFYRTALGAEVEMLMRYKENPDPQMCPDGGNIDPEMVMHASFKIGDSQIMASDGMASGQPNFRGVSLSLAVPDVATAQRLFGALAEGGEVQMPLTPTFYSPMFGMVADRFGVSWMVITQGEAGC